MRKLVWFTIGFGAACVLGSYFWTVQWALIPAGAAAVFSGVACLLWKKPQVRCMWNVCLGLCVGLGWFLGYDAQYTQTVRELDGKTVNARLVSYEFSRETDYGSSVDCFWELEGKRYRVRLYLDDKQEIAPWTVIETPIEVRLTTDGGRKEPTFHRSNGILALCYQEETAVVSVGDTSTEGKVVRAVAQLRRDTAKRIDEAFPDETAAFAKALLIGDKTGITYELNTVFKVSGISHIVAVSGLHISILFALVYVVTFKRRWLLAVVGIPVVCLFMAVAGFTPSVTRAGIMQILIIAALCLNREYDPPIALAVSALLMMAVNPLVASSVGFQLSVGSVAGIFLFYERISNWLKERIPEGKGKLWKGLRGWFASGLSVTLSAQLMTTPLGALYFGTISLVSVLTNLAVVWVVTFVFYGVMAVCLLGCISTKLAGLVGAVVALPIRYVLLTARVLAQAPMAAVYTESVYIVIWLAMCYGMLLGIVFGWNKRPLVTLCTAVICLCVALSVSWAEPLLYEHCVSVLDVGQGQCVILQHKGKTFVLDCGGDYASDAADKCAEKLLSMGISRIDGLIVSHMDADHCGGVEYLLSRIEVQALFVPVNCPFDGAQQVFPVQEDLVIESEGMKMTLFAPEIMGNDNESSIAVLFQTEKCDTLIINDMNTLGEQLLLKRTELPELELLVVGHHGSKSSTSEELLAATKPENAFISVGKNNRYGHPAPEVLERLTAAGCGVYRTDESGDLIYRR